MTSIYSPRYEDSLEAEVMSASPLRLVQLLTRGAVDAVAAARVHLRAGDIAARSRQITKAQHIINELTHSLDRARAPQIATGLAALYAYIQGRLLDANFRQAEEPLAEAQGLLSSLAEAWENAVPQPAALHMAFTGVGAAPEYYRSLECVG